MKLTFLALTFVFYGCTVFDLKIISSPAYSIGAVDNYVPPSNAFILFTYSANGKTYQNGYHNGLHGWNVASSGIHIGNKYMVQYDSLDPGTARMLFSYPVPDSATYRTYIALFKKTPPGYPSP